MSMIYSLWSIDLRKFAYNRLVEFLNYFNSNAVNVLDNFKQNSWNFSI